MGVGQALSFSAWILKILMSPPVPALWYWYLKTNVQPASPGVRHMRAPVSSSLAGSSSTVSTCGVISVVSIYIANNEFSSRSLQSRCYLKIITNDVYFVHAQVTLSVCHEWSCVVRHAFHAVLQLLASLSWTRLKWVINKCFVRLRYFNTKNSRTLYINACRLKCAFFK